MTVRLMEVGKCSVGLAFARLFRVLGVCQPQVTGEDRSLRVKGLVDAISLS